MKLSFITILFSILVAIFLIVSYLRVIFIAFRIIKELLKTSCQFLGPDNNGDNPLHLVCGNGHQEATELLLQSQIKCDAR